MLPVDPYRILCRRFVVQRLAACKTFWTWKAMWSGAWSMGENFSSTYLSNNVYSSNALFSQLNNCWTCSHEPYHMNACHQQIMALQKRLNLVKHVKSTYILPLNSYSSDLQGANLLGYWSTRLFWLLRSLMIHWQAWDGRLLLHMETLAWILQVCYSTLHTSLQIRTPTHCYWLGSVEVSLDAFLFADNSVQKACWVSHLTAQKLLSWPFQGTVESNLSWRHLITVPTKQYPLRSVAITSSWCCTLNHDQYNTLVYL